MEQTDIAKLTDRELDAEIARVLGRGKLVRERGREWYRPRRGDMPYSQPLHLPKFSADLNACREAEMQLTPEQFVEYCNMVAIQVTFGGGDRLDAVESAIEGIDDLSNMEKVIAGAGCVSLLATCREKAEALLEVLSQKLV